MEHKLRIEQVEAGNRYLKMVIGVKSLDAVEMAQLATHLQYAAPEYVLEAACAEPTNYEWWVATNSPHDNRHDRDDNRYDRDGKRFASAEGVSKMLANRRASLLRPVVPTLEEEVTDLIIQATSHKWPESVTSKEVLKIVQRRGVAALLEGVKEGAA